MRICRSLFVFEQGTWIEHEVMEAGRIPISQKTSAKRIQEKNKNKPKVFCIISSSILYICAGSLHSKRKSENSKGNVIERNKKKKFRPRQIRFFSGRQKKWKFITRAWRSSFRIGIPVYTDELVSFMWILTLSCNVCRLLHQSTAYVLAISLVNYYFVVMLFLK